MEKIKSAGKRDAKAMKATGSGPHMKAERKMPKAKSAQPKMPERKMPMGKKKGC